MTITTPFAIKVNGDIVGGTVTLTFDAQGTITSQKLCASNSAGPLSAVYCQALVDHAVATAPLHMDN